MVLSAVSVLVVAQSSLEIPEGLMNNPVFVLYISCTFISLITFNCEEERKTSTETVS